MKSGVFSALFIVYTIISFGVFFRTTSGWMSLFWFYAGGFFLTLLVVVIIARIISFRWPEVSIKIPRRLIMAIAITQILLLLLNPGDCSDVEVKGEHTYVRYLEYVMSGFTDYCEVAITTTPFTKILFHSPLATAMTWFSILYFPLLTAVVGLYCSTVWRQRPETATPGHKMLTLFQRLKDWPRHTSPQWKLLVISYVMGLVIFTALNIGMIVLAASQLSPGADVPWLKLFDFVISRLIGGPILLAASFNPLSPRYLSGAPSWGEFLLTSVPIPITIIAIMLAHPLKPNRRTAAITVFGVLLWFIIGSAAIGVAVT